MLRLYGARVLPTVPAFFGRLAAEGCGSIGNSGRWPGSAAGCLKRLGRGSGAKKRFEVCHVIRGVQLSIACLSIVCLCKMERASHGQVA